MKEVVARWLVVGSSAVSAAAMGEPATGGQSNIGQLSDDAAASIQWISPLSLPGPMFNGDVAFTVCGWIFQTAEDYAAAVDAASVFEADGLMRLVTP